MDEMVKQPWHWSLCDPMTLEQRCYSHCVRKNDHLIVTSHISFRSSEWQWCILMSFTYSLFRVGVSNFVQAKVLQNYEFKRRAEGKVYL